MRSLFERRSARLASAALLSLTMLAGCGGSPAAGPSQSTDAAHAVSGKAQLKERLEMMAQTGSGGSAVSGMRQGLDELKKTDAALADSLMKDLEALEKLQDQAAIKSAARKMADKLK